MQKYANALKTSLAVLPYDVIFYAFNTSQEEHESDLTHASTYYGEFQQGPVIKSATEMLAVIAGLHLAICMRYHSHIFSIIANTPFVSIANTPKVQFLMRDFTSNVVTTPDEIANAIDWALNHRELLVEKTIVVTNDNRQILESLRIVVDTPVGELVQQANNMLLNGKDPELISAHVLYNLTKSVTSNYTYGLIENIRKDKSLHDMISWVVSNHKNNRIKGLQLLQSTDEFAGVHRSGWEFATSYLKTLITPDGILCDLYTDGTFLWNERSYASQGIIPFKKLWIGFIHHTPYPYNENNLNKLFTVKSFLLSLRNCKALIVLSEYVRVWLKEKLTSLGFDNVRVYMVKHPSEFTSNTFNMFNFSANPRVVQVGAWLRNPYAIYRMNTWMKKHVLVGPNMSNYTLRRNGASCTRECNRHSQHNHIDRECHAVCACSEMYRTNGPANICHSPYIDTDPNHDNNLCTQYVLDYLWECGAPTCITFGDCMCNGKRFDTSITQLNKLLKRNYESVTTIEQLNNSDYDKLLSNSVVMIKLEDASAVNTLIECIIRNTPVIVNRLPAVVEYLGPKYPLYYNELSETSNFTIDHIRSAHIYLSKLNKVDLMVDSFVTSIKSILLQIYK